MMKSLKIMLFSLLLSLLALVSCQKQAPVAVQFHAYSADEAAQVAAEQDKLIFLFIYQDENDIYSKVFFEQIFRDSIIANYFNEHFVNVALDVDGKQVWPDLWENYGVYHYPVLLLLTPQGKVMTEISELGALGYDAQGQLPCRTPLMRVAALGESSWRWRDNDSLFFSKENWNRLNQINLRLDAELFHRVAANGTLLRERYGKDWDVMIDFNMAAAALRLMIYEEGKAPRCNDFRLRAFDAALVNYHLPLEDRYRLYADVNVAYGLGDVIKARQVAYQAYKNGVIQENEYLQLYDKL